MFKTFLRRKNSFKANNSCSALFISLDPNSDAISINFSDSKYTVSERASTLELWLRNSYSRNIMGNRMNLGMTWLQMPCRSSSDNSETWQRESNENYFCVGYPRA